MSDHQWNKLILRSSRKKTKIQQGKIRRRYWITTNKRKICCRCWLSIMQYFTKQMHTELLLPLKVFCDQNLLWIWSIKTYWFVFMFLTFLKPSGWESLSLVTSLTLPTAILRHRIANVNGILTLEPANCSNVNIW